MNASLAALEAALLRGGPADRVAEVAPPYKKLGGVNAVQRLSRLNRTHPDKEEFLVLDLANEASVIQAPFEPYYERTLVSEGSTAPTRGG